MNPWAWDVFIRRPAPTPGMLTQLTQLRAALPGYDVTLTSHSGSYRYEAIRRTDIPEAGPWCVISADPADLWRELAPRPRTAPAPAGLLNRPLACPPRWPGDCHAGMGIRRRAPRRHKQATAAIQREQAEHRPRLRLPARRERSLSGLVAFAGESIVPGQRAMRQGFSWSVPH